MPKRIVPLSDQQCKSALLGKHFDGGGLYLEVKETSKIWRMKYRFDGSENRLTFGPYPQMGLGQARKLRDEAKGLLARGIDPMAHKREQKAKAALLANNTFELIAREWYEHWKGSVTERHSSYTINRLSKDIFPVLGEKPIAEITAPMVLQVLRKVEARGAVEIAHRLKNAIGQVMRFGVHTGRLESDPIRDLQGALKPRPSGHYPSIRIEELPELLKALQDSKFRVFPLTRLALRLLLHTFVRSSELMKARWEEISFGEDGLDRHADDALPSTFSKVAVWSIPSDRMKKRREHVVPLSGQALDILKEIKTYSYGSEWIFPSPVKYNQPMNPESLGKALDLMGFKGRLSPHGFRALATGILIEKLGVPYDLVDLALAHGKDKVRGAYDRSARLIERKTMMQKYSKYLDQTNNN
jgi:integrase